MNVFQFFIICKRTNNANNASHYVKLGKKRQESSKRNCYIISSRVIIKAIIITLCQIKPLEIQIAQHHFNSKTVYKKQRTTGGMPHPKPTDLDMTKDSDYFVWKDTSERVARRSDYTVDKKRVYSCVLKHLFLEGVEQPKISLKNLRNALSNALLMSRFQKFAADAAKKKPRVF